MDLITFVPARLIFVHIHNKVFPVPGFIQRGGDQLDQGSNCPNEITLECPEMVVLVRIAEGKTVGLY